MEKKITTKRKILDSAIFLFGTETYDNVSVARICREANVSNGIIYKYFKNKSEIHEHILDIAVQKLSKNVTEIDGISPSTKLLSYIELTFSSVNNSRELMKASKEGEVLSSEYANKLKKDVYQKALRHIYGREIGEVEYLYMISGIHTITMKKIKKSIIFPAKCLKNFIVGGIGKNPILIKKNIKVNEQSKKDVLLEETLEVGAKLFSKDGIANIKVTDIVKASEMGLGKFYDRFKNKERFYGEIVKKIRKEVIETMKGNGFEEGTIVERAVEIIKRYLEYFIDNEYKYRLLVESEFVDSKSYNEFVETLEELLLTLLDMEKTEKNNIIMGSILSLAIYIGRSKYLRDEEIDVEKVCSELKIHLEKGITR